MAKTYRSDAMTTIHETATGLHAIGVLDEQTMREFDELCSRPDRVPAKDESRAIRDREQVSQAVFAREGPDCSENVDHNCQLL